MANPETEADRLIRVAEGVRTGMAGLSAEVGGLREQTSRNRFFVRVLGVSVVFDVLLSFGLGYAALQSRQAANRAARASSVAVVNCIAANENATKQLALWNYAFTFPPPPSETPEAKTQREKTTAEFKAYLARTFTQEDCSKLGKK